MCSAAAPTYFKPYKMDTDYYIDGGIFANNPSINGIVEAKRFFVGVNKPYKNFSLLEVSD